MRNNTNTSKLKNESIGKLLLSFAIPSTIALLISSLYNIIDAIFVGRAVGTIGIAALAVVFPLQVIIIAFGQLIGIGASSLSSRSYGENNLEKVKKITGNAITMNLVLTFIVVALGLIFRSKLLVSMGATPNIVSLAEDYMIIILSGSIFLSSGSILSSLTRSEGNIKIGVIAMIVGAVVNTGLDPILIFGFNMGIKGAAYASIISQFITFIILTVYIYRGNSILKFNISHLKIKPKLVITITTIGFSSFIRLIIGSIIVIIINNSLRLYGGDMYISIYGSITRVLTFLMMPIYGLIQALQPILGFNYGMKDKMRVMQTIRKSKVMALIIGIFITLCVEVFASQIVGMFSQNTEFINNGVKAIRIVFLAIPIIGIQMVASGIFQAIGKVGYALTLAILRQLILIPFVLFLPNYNNLGILGIWLSFPISDFIATIITLILQWKSEKRISEELTII